MYGFRLKKIPLNPLNFSPIGIYCRNGRKNLEGQEAFAVRFSLCRASYGIFFFYFIIALNLILIFILLIYDKY